MKNLCLKGKIFSGASKGAEFVRLPWVGKQIEEKLGFKPYPGTLNIRLNRDSTKLRKTLETTEGIKVCPPEGFHAGKCFKAYMTNMPECAVVIPQVPRYPKSVVEIIAPVNLREEYSLKDGSTIEIEIML